MFFDMIIIVNVCANQQRKRKRKQFSRCLFFSSSSSPHLHLSQLLKFGFHHPAKVFWVLFERRQLLVFLGLWDSEQDHVVQGRWLGLVPPHQRQMRHLVAQRTPVAPHFFHNEANIRLVEGDQLGANKTQFRSELVPTATD